MLETDPTQLRVSTGIAALDDVLGGLYWGDNVVWELDHMDGEEFYAAIAGLEDAFETRAFIAVTAAGAGDAPPGADVLRAGPGTALPAPADLLHEIHTLCRASGRRLLLFESLNRMVEVWGAQAARGFFARCCPFLLEASAIAYWTMDAFATPPPVRETVAAVTQCVLHVDDRSVRVSKAEGRDDGVPGTVLHWHRDGAGRVLEAASVTGRIAGSLRALRRTRELSQHDLARLAGVTPSAISQAERAERGLSLTTLARLSAALGITIDDLLRGEDPTAYRIGRRVEDPQRGGAPAITLLGSRDTDLRIDLVQLAPRESGEPMYRQRGSGIVAVATGLVQVEVGAQTPSVRHGEVLVADSERVRRWRNVGYGDARLFWIVFTRVGPPRPHRSMF